MQNFHQEQDTLVQCFSSRERLPARTRRSRGGWTEEEDCLLRESVGMFQGRQWRKIAECLPGRTVSQCFCRWKRVLSPAYLKGTWRKEEDDCIMELVGKYGAGNPSTTPKSLPGRLRKQCGERANNEIKNHWNCLRKKKRLSLYSPNNRALDFFEVGSPNFGNCCPNACWINENKEEQNIDKIECNYKFKTNALGLDFDILNKEKNKAEASNCTVDFCRSSAWMDESKKGVYFDESMILATDLNLSLDVPASTSLCISPFEAALPVRSEPNLSLKKLESFEPGILQLTLSNNSDRSCYPSASNSISCYEEIEHCLNQSYQSESSLTIINGAKLCSEDNLTSLFGHSTTKIVAQDSSCCVGLESILRKAARTFKNTPSIIRKRPSVKTGSY